MHHTCGRATRENPLVGTNRKIGPGRVDVSLTAGSPKAGGTCGGMTEGCQACYAQNQEMVMASMRSSHDVNSWLARTSPEQFADAVIADFQREIDARRRRNIPPLRLVRVHGYGDFFSTAYVRAWIRIAKSFPGIRFFGTTRMWQAWNSRAGRSWGVIRDLPAFKAALEEFRNLPNVFLGGSVDESTRFKEMTTSPGETATEWLRRNGWSIWNALTDFQDKGIAAAAGVSVIRGDPHHVKPEVRKAARLAAKEQFAWAEASGALIGVGCYEQQGERKNCSTCGHCARKGAEVTFAYHSGASKRGVRPRVTPSYVEGVHAQIRNLRRFGIDVGAAADELIGADYGASVPVGGDAAVVYEGPKQVEAAAVVIPTTALRKVVGNPRRDVVVTPGLIKRTADIFVRVLRDWLTPAEFAEMRRRNDTAKYRDGGACASHDFCDANMAMLEAIGSAVGFHPDVSARWYTDLHNAAWDAAQSQLTEGAHRDRRPSVKWPRPTNRNPPKRFHLIASERDKECGHDHVAWSGSIPCTGVVRCAMCGEQWRDMESAKSARSAARDSVAGIRPVMDNPSLIIVAGNPPAAEMEKAWCHFHQKDEYSGKTVRVAPIRGAPPFTFALGRLEDLDLGDGISKVRPRPWLVCNPADDSLWIVANEPMDCSKVAGKRIHRITYDPTAESGKEPAFYRHKFASPFPVLSPVGGPKGCRAILLEGGRYSVRDWIYD